MEYNFKDDRLFFSNYDSFEDWSSITVGSEGVNIDLLYLNIRSIGKNWDTLMLQILSSNANFDCIILAEVFCSEDELPLFNIPYYSKVSKFREKKKGGGLIMFFNTQTVSFKTIDICNINTYEHITGELELIGTEEPLKILLHAVYRPPTSSSGFPLPHFIQEIGCVLDNLRSHRNMIFLGDTNINTKNNYDTNVLNYEAILAEWGLEKGIWGYTREEIRLESVTTSCIDHIYYKIDGPIEQIFTGIIKTKISDHYIIVAKLQLKGGGKRDTEVEKVRIFNENILKNKLRTENWHIGESRDINNRFEMLINKFKDIYDESSIDQLSGGRKSYHNKGFIKSPLKEWMNPEILNLIKERDRVFRLWKGDPSNYRHRQLYKRLRNKLNSKIKTRKNSYYKQVFQNNKGDSRKIWRNVNYLLGRGQKSNIDSTIDTSMGKHMSRKDIVNGFAKYFVDGVKALKHNCIYAQDQIEGSNREINQLKHYFYIPKATPEKIESIIQKMNIHKSPGADLIRIRDIKSVGSSISSILCQLINQSVSQGIFPDCLKTSIIRPIYKNKSKKEFQNYRPIAILPVIGKIIEKYVLDSFNKYISENNILSSKQYGFRKNCSTVKALEDFSYIANGIMNSRCHGLALFIDFSKAFDTVEHNHTISALYKIGVRGPYLNWFRSYLENRKFVVKAVDTISDETSVTFGVPQGSQIGPVLFIIYLNEILEKINNCHIYAYADDVLLLAEHKDLKIAEQILQDDFKTFTKWAHDKGLIINFSKTCLMHICPKNMKIEKAVNIKYHECECLYGWKECQCKSITIVEKVKYLGLTVDRKLTWKDHIRSLHKKLRPCVVMMHKLENKLSTPVKRTIYKSLFESIMRYGITVWGTAADTHINLVANLQNKCLTALYKNDIRLGLVTGRNNQQYTSVIGELSPKGLYMFLIILEFFSKDEFKMINRRSRTTRNTAKYVTPIPRTVYGERLPNYIVPYFYNMLPNEIENIINYSTFKKTVYKWITTEIGIPNND